MAARLAARTRRRPSDRSPPPRARGLLVVLQQRSRRRRGGRPAAREPGGRSEAPQGAPARDAHVVGRGAGDVPAARRAMTASARSGTCWRSPACGAARRSASVVRRRPRARPAVDPAPAGADRLRRSRSGPRRGARRAPCQHRRRHRRRSFAGRASSSSTTPTSGGRLASSDGHVFTREDGEPWHPDRVRKLFEEAVATVDVPRIRMHDLRHTWATLALRAGVHPKVVQERLGHANITHHHGHLLARAARHAGVGRRAVAPWRRW